MSAFEVHGDRPREGGQAPGAPYRGDLPLPLSGNGQHHPIPQAGNQPGFLLLLLLLLLFPSVVVFLYY